MSANSSTTDLEKGVISPAAKGSETPQRSCFASFIRFISSEYRILFTFIFVINLIGMIAFGWEWCLHGRPNEQICTLAATINIAMSIVIREEHVVNALYYIFTAVPKTAPLWIRRRMGKIYHLGGLHSGCAVAATIWFILLSVEKTISFARITQPSAAPCALIGIIFTLDVLLMAMCIMAYPTIRAKLHNAFELVHRLAGWSALGLFWALVILDAFVNNPSGRSLAIAIVANANLWLVLLSTCSIISTWLNCRKLPVTAQKLSSHAIRLFFNYAKPQPGTTIRLSSQPLLEWHAFATVTDPEKEGFSLIVSNAGDWTKKLISEPPKQIWARRHPTCGVLRIAPMFKSIVLVATGSGIAPCLPVILAKQTDVTLFWSTRDPLETYGPEIGAIIANMGKKAHIHNTTTMGRPNTLPTVLDLYEKTRSEAVVVISNPKLTLDLVLDLEARGIPAFGPIWDS